MKNLKFKWLLLSFILSIASISQVWASTFNNANIFFDASGWGTTTYVYFVVGNNSSSSLFQLNTHITNTNLYRAYCNNGSDWNNASYYAVIGTSSGWTGGNWGYDNCKKASCYTGNYTGSYNMNNSSNFYLLTPESSSNGASFDISYKSGGITDLNSTQTVTVQIWGGSSYSDASGCYGTSISASTYYFNSGWDSADQNGSIALSSSTTLGTASAAFTSTVSLSLSGTVTSGYEFVGWYKSDGTLISRSTSASYAVRGATTVYARFAPTYTVNFAANNDSYGSISPSGDQPVGQKPVAVSATPNTNYIFDSWNYDNTKITLSDKSESADGATANVTAKAAGTLTAKFADQWAIAGIAESGTTADFGYFRGLPYSATNTYSKTYTLAEGTYTFKVVDRKTNTWYTDNGAEITRENYSKTADDANTGNNMTIQVDLAGDYTFTFNSSSKLLTVTYPTYTEALSSMSVAKGDYVLGGDGSTSGNTMKIYSSMVSSANFTMTVSPTSSSQGGTIKYAIGSTEKGTVTSPQTIAASTIGLTTSAVQYTFKAYFKKGTYKSTGTEKTVSYYIQKTTDPVVTLATQISSANATNADLETNPTISLVAAVSNNLVDVGTNFTYYVKTPGAADWAEVASSAGTSTTYAPAAIGEYKFKVKWTHQIDWESEEVSFVVWKKYTIYVWDPDNYAKRVHIYNGFGSKYAWSSTEERMTSESASWGTGWYSFIIQYPLYTKYKVHLDSDAATEASQSEEYTFTQEPLVANNNIYFRCTNKASENWLMSSIEEPQAPTITITSVNIYATKMVIDVAYDNHYSLLTASSLTVDGEAKDISGSVTNVGGGTYRCTLTGLDENTDYTFCASATNALGTTNEVEVITTLAKMPITWTIRVRDELMNGSNWGANGRTSIKVKYWNNNSGLPDGTAELSLIKISGGYHWYKYTFPDSPVSFYTFNANGNDGSGYDRSSDWYDASSNGCARVENTTHGTTHNHDIFGEEMCGIHYRLAYYNGVTTIYSNAIGDESDKMSLFIGAYNGGEPAGRSLTLYQYDTDWDTGTNFDLATLNLSDSAVYVFSLNKDADFDNAKSLSAWDCKKYTGNYYIRTDHAPGGRNNYRGNSNKMTYSDYAANATGSTFDHYFCKWVQGTSDDQRNVSFTVANDYSDNLLGGSNMYVSDDYATGSGYLKQNASVRFMYDSRTNDLSRAYLSGSSSERDLFLVLRGDHESGYHLWKDADKTNEHTTNGTTDWAFFKDNNNWVYQVDAYAKPGTRIKLTAQMTNSAGDAQQQSFKGDASSASFDVAHTDLLIGGTTSETAYPMRIIYDFKTNRLMTAWLPSELSTDLGINADVMLIRNGQGDAQHITLNNHQLTDVHTVYAVMQFNRWRLNNRANPETMTVESCARKDGTDNWVYDETVTNTNHPAIAEGASGWLSRYERDLYWISFPFDVNLNEVFGSVGTYGTHWIIEYYDGKGRAKNGFWADSPSNWKFINNVNTTLKANVGYILALDLDYFAYNNTTTWANNIHQVELYFPSMVSVETIKQDDVVVHIDTVGYQCTINRGTADGDRRIKDSHWHCIGVPSFANTTHGTNTDWTTGEGTKDEVDAGDYPDRTDWTSPDLPYLYEWVPSDNSLKPVNSSSTTFEAMYSYLVQYNKDTIKWMQVAAPAVSAPASIAARQLDTDMRDFEYCLKLNKDSIIQDQTFVRFTDDANVTNGFEFNYDLCKEQNGGKGNIWTVTTDVIPVAGNSMPKPLQTTLVPVGVKVVTGGEYTLAMPEGTNGEDVYLIDNAYGTRTNLGLMPYTVTLTAGTYDSRFALEFAPIQDAPTGIEQMSTVNYQLSTEEVRKVFVGGRLYIIRDGKVYDAAGQRVE